METRSNLPALPLRKKPEKEGEEKKQMPMALVVDDDHNVLEIMTQMLLREGFGVYSALDGVEGWDIYIKYKPALVITDIYMPRKNGILLLSQIKSENPEQPVIFITGYSNYRQMLVSLKVPPDGYIEKPFTRKQLMETIDTVLVDTPKKE
ncbi:MAG: response regulator [Candidatus Electryonea clarkiae]|nr:response regulator [Candidatus Electryonea clarkiae]MDP8288161.1 response regulator [Candidatus Electryonea clarkiae]